MPQYNPFNARGNGAIDNPYNFDGWVSAGHEAANFDSYNQQAQQDLTKIANSKERGGSWLGQTSGTQTAEYQGPQAAPGATAPDPWKMGGAPAVPAAQAGYPAMPNSYGLGQQTSAPAPQSFDYTNNSQGKAPVFQSSHGANPWSIGNGEAGSR